jgi:delta-aminolevulinic acid dehydratase/porphobilinogen synthase
MITSKPKIMTFWSVGSRTTVLTRSAETRNSTKQQAFAQFDLVAPLVVLEVEQQRCRTVHKNVNNFPGFFSHPFEFRVDERTESQ